MTKYNNFAQFYQQFLKGQNNVVVLSMSTLAPIVAYSLGLPFYCKGGRNKEECKNDAQLWRDHIKREAGIESICMHTGVDCKTLDLGRLETYECGAAIHFIEKYFC